MDAIVTLPIEKLAILAVFGGGTIIAVIGILAWMIKSTAERKEFERSRREIAAYIAEGSMSAEQGQRLLAESPLPKDED